jgi:hypothetical protein
MQTEKMYEEGDRVRVLNRHSGVYEAAVVVDVDKEDPTLPYKFYFFGDGAVCWIVCPTIRPMADDEVCDG